MKTVSILGCGWLGKPLAISLLKKGFTVNGSTTTISKIEELSSLGIQPYLIDIAIENQIEDFLNADILIIAITNKEISDFKRLITRIQKSQVKKVIYISTTSVYPSLNKVMSEISETVNSPYLQIEDLLRENINFKTTIIRFSGLFGKDRHPANWFQNGREIPQPNGFVNMIHQDDCIQIIQKIIEQDCFGEVFNACCNHHPTRKEFYEKAKKNKGLEAPVFKENEELQWKIISSEKVQKVLKYKFIHDDLFAI